MSIDTEFAVIGGGIIGASVAWGLCRAGAAVTMLDGGDRDFRASVGNFGNVTTQGKGANLPPYADLSHQSALLWPEFAQALRETSDIDVNYVRSGAIHLFSTEKELDTFNAKIARIAYKDERFRSVILDQGDLRRDFPLVGHSVLAGAYSPMDGSTNPLQLLKALHVAVIRAGGTIFSSQPATEIIPGRDGYTIRCSSMQVRASKIVLAAGLGTRPLARQLDMDVPVRPQRGQILVTDRSDTILPFTTSSVRQTPDRTIMIGATQDETGFDKSTNVSGMAWLAREGIRHFPFLAGLNIVRSWGCLRIVPADGGPIYQEAPEFPGAYVVTAHSGITISPYHALVLAPSLASGGIPAAVKDLSLKRFNGAACSTDVDSH